MVQSIIILTASAIILISGNFQSFQDPDKKQLIVDTTVMITITVPELDPEPEIFEALPIPPDEYRRFARPDSYIVAEGLGTLSIEAGELYIITHDHWSVLDHQLGEVRIRDGRGQLMVKLDLFRFKKLIVYQDSGTMILTSPKELAALWQQARVEMPAHAPDRTYLVAGSEVSLAYRQRNGQAGVAVMNAIVESVGEKQGKPIVRLRNTDGMSIIGGDSGGGVWLSGEIVANTWTTITKKDLQTGENQTTNFSTAALLNQEFVG